MLADEGAPGPRRDLKILMQFEQSLSTGVRMAAIAPLALIGILLGAYILARCVFKSYDRS